MSAPLPIVWFIDTSVLCEILDVPGMADERASVMHDLAVRAARGDRFVLPVTAVIETGNHICNVKVGDRRAAAQRFVGLVRTAASEDDTRISVLGTTWDAAFLEQLCAGASTGQTFVELAGGAQLGGGDVAILVERDAFRRRSVLDAKIWTKERVLGSYGT